MIDFLTLTLTPQPLIECILSGTFISKCSHKIWQFYELTDMVMIIKDTIYFLP